CLQYDNLRTF
nr:immunoglobulin light chain junction region [Mus musculus]NSL97425.1 immunoglobulin light chain junction region [Mus musculus]NSL97630.1 immunoglobulin light chain junction region [Mus musculus]NSL97844.1 immunoglobulin light chain junction region [Mus musculus]NSL97870.1 immunoglobulin light chain junction region [Mus musculus]